MTSAATELLARGQEHEARGEITAAIACYDQAITFFRTQGSEDPEIVRRFGVAWMNRGNALQKLPGVEQLAPAVDAYDEAIAQLQSLPFDTTPAYRNHLGAAWLNRGHALLLAADSTAAAESFERAVALLRYLPLAENVAYRLNLAGAWTNLAHVCVSPPFNAFPRAHAAAQTALDLLKLHERNHLVFAEMSLRARRALVTALGELLVIAERARQPTFDLAAQASDVVDEGLALARRWEKTGEGILRPLARRLFRLGTQLYRVHQPHFLAEFVHDNLSLNAFADDAEFRAIAAEAIASALADVQRPQLLVAGTPDAEKLLATARSLRSAFFGGAGRAPCTGNGSVEARPPPASRQSNPTAR